MKMDRKKKAAFVLTAAFILLLFLAGNQSYEVHHSSIFSSSDLTEIRLCIIMNNLLPVERESMAEKIVKDNIRLNGERKNAIYELELYRTTIHYELNWKYDTVFCNENGEIIENFYE